MSFHRALRPPKDSFFLWGCRGIGKITWLRQHFESATWVDLLDEEDEELYQQLLVNPKLFPARLRAAEAGSWMVVNEVQRLPNLPNEVHRAIEQSKLKSVLCGSSARKLKRDGVNLLGGRASSCHMHPFLPEALAGVFDLDLALMHGTLPLVWDSADRTARLRAYGQLYLKEQIKAEALVRNLPGFARFMQIAAIFNGQVINVSGLARDAGVANTTVEGYLDVLEDTLLTFRVPAYEARLRVKERGNPKLYWTEPGLVRSAKGWFGPLHVEQRGAVFEGMVAQYLRAAGDY